VPSNGAAGSMFEDLSKLACTLDPAAIEDRAGIRAECSYEAPNKRLKIHAFPPGDGGNCRHLN
jgi:hypothetical protein